MRGILLITLCGILGPAGSAAAAAKAQVTVRPTSQVASVQVRLSDLADIVTSDRTLAESLRILPICAGPLPGRSRTITREQIKSCLSSRGFGEPSVVLLCPPEVTINRAAVVVTGTQLFAAARDYIVAHAVLPGRVEVEPLRVPPDQTIPAGKLEIRIGRPGAVIRKGANTVCISLIVDGRLHSVLNLSANVRVFAPVVVTTKHVARGEELTAANTRVEEREVTLHADDLISAPLEFGLTAAAPLQEGQVLQSAHVKARPAIRSGDGVTVLVTGETVRLSERGAAVQDGRVGERIKVRLAGEVREVRGIVRAPGLVHIDLRRKDSCNAEVP